jgi:Co/Zn/Cd efflux system component
MSNCDCSVEIESKEQRRVLIILLVINAIMFIVEISAGFIAESTALIADSLDMLADAVVYGVGLYAVGKAVSAKANAAMLSGIFQIILALGVAIEILRRIYFGSDPESLFMIVISFIALAANVICLLLIAKHRKGEVHMRASWIFSKNDVIANIGVILSGLLVFLLGSRWPDIMIGTIIVLIVLRGGILIINDARREIRSLG